MRKYFNLYNLAAVLLLIFDLGHTLGGVVFHRSSGPKEDAVLAVMESTHFDFNGTDSSYMGFHQGYGLLTTIFLALGAFICWQLGKHKGSQAMAGMLFFCFIGVAVISWKYFFPGPGVLSTAVAIILGYEWMKGLLRAAPT